MNSAVIEQAIKRIQRRITWLNMLLGGTAWLCIIFSVYRLFDWYSHSEVLPPVSDIGYKLAAIGLLFLLLDYRLLLSSQRLRHHLKRELESLQRDDSANASKS